MALRDDEQRFIADVTALLSQRGLTPSMGRVYGYLLLQHEPTSLEQIARDLEMSKVSAWKAARGLEPYEHVRRFGTPGSKRALYAISDNFGSPFLEQAAVLGSMGALLKNCAANTASGESASQLDERAHFYFSIQNAMLEKVAELNAQRATVKNRDSGATKQDAPNE